jgi:hypothetical protein
MPKRTKKRRNPKSKKKITKKKTHGFLSWWRNRQQRKKNKQNTEKKLQQGNNKYKNYRYQSQKLNEAEKFGAKNNSSWFNSIRGTIEPLKQNLSPKNNSSWFNSTRGTIESLKQNLSPKNVNKLLSNLKNKKGENSTYNIKYLSTKNVNKLLRNNVDYNKPIVNINQNGSPTRSKEGAYWLKFEV